MKNNKKTITKLFYSNRYKHVTCLLAFTGEFIPYDHGIRYHKDGSGTPPSPEEFEIESSKLLDGDPIALIDVVSDYYSTGINTEDFLDQLSYELAKELQEAHDASVSESFYEFD